jgi:hypothetical protein
VRRSARRASASTSSGAGAAACCEVELDKLTPASNRHAPPISPPGGLIPAAVAYGLATAVLPLCVLFPSLGYGFLGRRSGEAARLARIMLVGHAAFGAGIALGTALTRDG